MPLTGDQKKHLLIGGGVSALALVAGYMIFGRRRAPAAAALPGRAGRTDMLHDGRRRRHRHEQGRPSAFIEVENERGEYGEKSSENARGEYGQKRHHHHDHGEHGHD